MSCCFLVVEPLHLHRLHGWILRFEKGMALCCQPYYHRRSDIFQHNTQGLHVNFPSTLKCSEPVQGVTSNPFKAPSRDMSPCLPLLYVINASCIPLCFHLYKVSTAFQAFKQHPHWLYESVSRRLFLIDFPMDTSCPPSEAVFLFSIPTAHSHDQRSPWRVVRIPATVFTQQAGRVCVCVRACCVHVGEEGER